MTDLLSKSDIHNTNNETVWVIQRLYTNNLGDRMLGKGLEELLCRQFLRVNRIELVVSQKLMKKIAKWLYILGIVCFVRSICYLPLAFIQKPRYIIVGGGQLLLPNSNFLWSILGWTTVARIIGAKLVLFGVGAEEKGHPYTYIQKKILRKIWKHAYAIRLRDSHSQKLLSKILEVDQVPLAPDTAYGLQLRTQFNKKRGINVCPASFDSIYTYNKYRTKEEYYRVILEETCKQYQSGEMIYVFSTTPSDMDAVKDISICLQKIYGDKVITITMLSTEKALLDQLCQGRLTISSRLHGLILSHILGIELSVIGAKDKLISSMDWLYSKEPAILRMELEASLKSIFQNS